MTKNLVSAIDFVGGRHYIKSVVKRERELEMTNTVTTLTSLEENVLLATLAFWNYGDETEKEDNAVMFDLYDLRAETGLALNSLKGIVGSLFKKDIFCEMVGGELGNQVEIGITDEGIDMALQLIREKDALV